MFFQALKNDLRRPDTELTGSSDVSDMIFVDGSPTSWMSSDNSMYSGSLLSLRTSIASRPWSIDIVAFVVGGAETSSFFNSSQAEAWRFQIFTRNFQWFCRLNLVFEMFAKKPLVHSCCD